MSAKKYTLAIRTGPQEGTVFDLDKETVILGRDVTNDIVLADAEVSRRHSRLTLSPQGYVLEDLGSTNGTFVNGERLTGPHLLTPGDQLGLSQKLVISFELGAEAVAQTVAVEPVVKAPTHKLEEPVAEAPPQEVEKPAVEPLPTKAEKQAVEAPPKTLEEPLIEAPPGTEFAPAAEPVAQKPKEFEVIKEAAPADKKRRNRWIYAGIGCVVLTVVCGGILWFMDANYDNILYAPLNALMRLLGFQ
jgi:pSer/pThr/pTyr-binding forkhead associated (FHA) protein